MSPQGSPAFTAARRRKRSCVGCVLARAMEADASETAAPWRSRQHGPGDCLSGARKRGGEQLALGSPAAERVVPGGTHQRFFVRIHCGVPILVGPATAVA